MCVCVHMCACVRVCVCVCACVRACVCECFSFRLQKCNVPAKFILEGFIPDGSHCSCVLVVEGFTPVVVLLQCECDMV